MSQVILDLVLSLKKQGFRKVAFSKKYAFLKRTKKWLNSFIVLNMGIRIWDAFLLFWRELSMHLCYPAWRGGIHIRFSDAFLEKGSRGLDYLIAHNITHKRFSRHSDWKSGAVPGQKMCTQCVCTLIERKGEGGALKSLFPKKRPKIECEFRPGRLDSINAYSILFRKAKKRPKIECPY